jgi:hypothetical protein
MLRHAKKALIGLVITSPFLIYTQVGAAMALTWALFIFSVTIVLCEDEQEERDEKERNK